MASETTGLLSGCIVNIPKDKDEYEILNESQKTKSLSLEELMPFQDDPWWQNLRKTFFLSFWLTLIIVFVSACTLSILQHGSCQGASNIILTTPTKDPIITLIGSGSAKMTS